MGGDTMRIEQALIDLVHQIIARTQADPTDQIATAWADGGSFIIDTTGVGKGIADHLLAKGYTVTYFDSSTPLRDKRYGNPRAEAYMTMREAFQAGTAAIPPNAELLAELLSVKYEVKHSGKTYIESKDQIRDRIGHSPDLADICAMALGGAAEVCTVRPSRNPNQNTRPVHTTIAISAVVLIIPSNLLHDWTSEPRRCAAGVPHYLTPRFARSALTRAARSGSI